MTSNVPDDFLITALDLPTADQALDLVNNLGPACRFYKVGMELFFSAGRSIIREIQAGSSRRKIFLDLKIHDIPATMERTVAVLADLGVDFLTLFADPAEVEAARRAVDHTGSPLKLLNVTVLTSMSGEDLRRSGVELPLPDRIRQRARLSQEAGAHGIICSATDLDWLRSELPPPFLMVTPGIRPPEAEQGDQQRVATPQTARQAGADHIVVGRPIRDAADPQRAARELLNF